MGANELNKSFYGRRAFNLHLLAIVPEYVNQTETKAPIHIKIYKGKEFSTSYGSYLFLDSTYICMNRATLKNTFHYFSKRFSFKWTSQQRFEWKFSFLF